MISKNWNLIRKTENGNHKPLGNWLNFFPPPALLFSTKIGLWLILRSNSMPKNFWDFEPPCFGKRVRMFKCKYRFCCCEWTLNHCTRAYSLEWSNGWAVFLTGLCLSSPNLLFSLLFYDSGAGPLQGISFFFFPNCFPLRVLVATTKVKLPDWRKEGTCYFLFSSSACHCITLMVLHIGSGSSSKW